MRPLGAVLVAVWLASAVVSVASCGHAPRGGDRVRESDAIVFVRCELRDASVWVNERRIGLVADVAGGIALSPGTHRLEVRHDNFHTHYANVALTARQRLELPVTLAEILR